MGSTSNGVNPLNIKPHIDTKEVEVNNLLDGSVHVIDPAGFNISLDYCHISYDGAPACSCQDCQKSCGDPPPPIVDPEPCLIMGKVWLLVYGGPAQPP